MEGEEGKCLRCTMGRKGRWGGRGDGEGEEKEEGEMGRGDNVW